MLIHFGFEGSTSMSLMRISIPATFESGDHAARDTAMRMRHTMLLHVATTTYS